MKPEFEEKVYESWFNSELSRKYPIYFPPGQVCENSLGFDAAFFINDVKFQRYQLHQSWNLNFLFQNKNIPNIELNCFFQYKRPEYITTSNGREWKDWRKPYFRYKIYSEQQQILEKLNRKLNGKALILYAAPATIKIKELYDFYINKRIIQQSNFTNANKLINHHINTYIKNGSSNKAFSEPEEFDSHNFDNHLQLSLQFIRENNISQQRDFIKNTIYIANIVKEIMSKNEQFRFVFQNIIENFEEHEEFIMSLYIMHQFKLLTGIQWCCIYEQV